MTVLGENEEKEGISSQKHIGLFTEHLTNSSVH